jgi:hypothetical protein
MNTAMWWALEVETPWAASAELNMAPALQPPGSAICAHPRVVAVMVRRPPDCSVQNRAVSSAMADSSDAVARVV